MPQQKVIKAGCILINPLTKQIGLIYRKKHQDYTFAKGHKEENETIIDCAIRETIEETQREIEILCQLDTLSYLTKKQKLCTVYWYLAKDLGPSNKVIDEDLKHQLIWIDMDKVEGILSYENLKELWFQSKQKINSYL